MIVFLSVFLECLAAIFQIGLLVTAGAGLEKMVRVGRYRAGLCRWSWLRAPCRTLPAEGRGRPARAITRDLEEERKKKNSTSTISLEKKTKHPPNKTGNPRPGRTKDRLPAFLPRLHPCSVLCPPRRSRERGAEAVVPATQHGRRDLGRHRRRDAHFQARLSEICTFSFFFSRPKARQGEPA